MISQVIGKGIVKLDKKDFKEVLTLIPHELPNVDMYDSVCQFKTMGMDGKWLLFEIVKVDGEDEVEKGINIFVHRIEEVVQY